MSDTNDIIHPTSQADLLRIPIRDALEEAGHLGLADEAAKLADWMEIVRPFVRAANIAGEPIKIGEILSRGPDQFLYRTRSPIPMAGVVGIASANSATGERVSWRSLVEYQRMTNSQPHHIEAAARMIWEAAGKADTVGVNHPRIDPELRYSTEHDPRGVSPLRASFPAWAASQRDEPPPNTIRLPTGEHVALSSDLPGDPTP